MSKAKAKWHLQRRLVLRLRQGVAAQHQATAFQEASRTARHSVVQQAMGQGAPWRLLRLWHDVALAIGLWHAVMCARCHPPADVALVAVWEGAA